MVANKVPELGRLVAGLQGPRQRLDFHWIRRIVEVNHVDVKDQHSRARDLVSWGQNGDVDQLGSRGLLQVSTEAPRLPRPGILSKDGVGCLPTWSTLIIYTVRVRTQGRRGEGHAN